MHHNNFVFHKTVSHDSMKSWQIVFQQQCQSDVLPVRRQETVTESIFVDSPETLTHSMYVKTAGVV